MHDNCRACRNDYFVGGESVESVLVNDCAVAHDGIARFRNLHRALVGVAVKNENKEG